jgi:hypothetical protein
MSHGQLYVVSRQPAGTALGALQIQLTATPASVDRLPQASLGAPLDEQRHIFPDRCVIELGLHLAYGRRHFVGRKFREQLGQPVDDLDNRTVLS